MKVILPLLSIVLALLSCNNADEADKNSTETPAEEKVSFFKVTSYLKGEIYNIKKKGINPLKYTTVNDHTDSVWVKLEDMDTVLQEFLQPEIDSANLSTLFTGKSFFDQTLNSITMTYEPSVALPDSMYLKRWDVYIDPKAGTVKRVFIVKELSKNKTLQLTWVNDKWCKMVYIDTDQNGTSKIEKEEKLVWDF